MNHRITKSFARISKFAALASLALVISASANAQTVELTTNGGFEDNTSITDPVTGNPTFNGWQSFAATGFTAESSSPFEGSFNGRLFNDAAASASVIKQANMGIGVVGTDQEVTISFRARGSAAAGGVHFAEFFSEVDGGGVSKAEILGGGPLFPASDTAWQLYEFTTTTGNDVSGGVTLQFAATTGGDNASVSTLEIDNVSVTIAAVPEPSSLALLGLGSTFLLARRRR